MSEQFTISNATLIKVKIECFGAVERLLPNDLNLEFESEMSIADVLASVAYTYPEASKMLERCACAMGEDIIPRQTILSSDSTVVLLSPVAGG